MKYRMPDGTVLNTDKATQSWGEQRDFDGNNFISRNTGSQWDHQGLHRSRRGRYYLEHTSQWQGSKPWAEWISPQQAAAWLELNDHPIPKELAEAAEQISE